MAAQDASLGTSKLGSLITDKQLVGLTPDKQQLALFQWLNGLAQRIQTSDTVRLAPLWGLALLTITALGFGEAEPR